MNIDEVDDEKPEPSWKDRKNVRTQSQMRRILQVLKVVASKRFAHTVDDIHHELQQMTGEHWHRRTILRDLQLLEALGAVDRTARCTFQACVEYWSQPIAKQTMQMPKVDDSKNWLRNPVGIAE